MKTFDESKFVLGIRCGRNHLFDTTGQTLRYKSGACVDCQKENCKKRYQEKRDLILRQSKDWARRNPAKRQEIFKRYCANHVDDRKRRLEEYRQNNKPKLAARMRAYRKENPEIMRACEARRQRSDEQKKKLKVISKRWRDNNPESRQAAYQRRRALLDSCVNTLTAKEILLQRKLQSGLCWYCKRTLDNKGRGHIEHKIPLVRGGDNAAENIVIACASCNLRKGSMTAEEFKEKMLNVDKLRDSPNSR